MTATALKTEVESERVLVIERVFKARPKAVFDAFAEPEHLVKWFGPEGATITHHEQDCRPGGAYTITLFGEQMGSNTVSGVYQEVDDPHSLSFTWAWTQEDGSRGNETIVSLTFAEHDNGTLLRLHQAEFAEVEFRDRHEFGWSSSFNKLESFVQT